MKYQCAQRANFASLLKISVYPIPRKEDALYPVIFCDYGCA